MDKKPSENLKKLEQMDLYFAFVYWLQRKKFGL